MARIVVVAILGIALGAAAASFLIDRSSPDGAVGDGGAVPVRASAPAAADLPDVESLLDAPLGAAERATIFELTGQANLATLDALLSDAARRPDSADRQFLLGTLLTRIAESDPEHALELLSRLDLDARTARAMALVWLEEVGTDADGIAIVLAALPQIDERRLRLSAIARYTAAAPEAALELALKFDDEEFRLEAVREVAGLWAEQDAQTALRRAESIEDTEARLRFQSSALAQMARADVASAVDYLERRYQGSAVQRSQLMGTVAMEAARSDPRMAFEIAARMGPSVRDSLQRTAIDRMARQDPLAAFAYADQLPSGHARSLRAAAAREFGAQAPDAALAWAGGLDPRSPELVHEVVIGVSRADPLRAIELLETGDQGPDLLNYMSVIYSAVIRGSSSVSPAEVGNRLLNVGDDADRQRWVGTFVQAWSDFDPQGTLDWLVANNERVDTGLYAQLAQWMAQQDPTAAFRYQSQLPPGARDVWASAVARNVAASDPAAALEWLAQFRDAPAYDAAAAAVADGVAATHPTEAVSLFAALSPARQVEAAQGIALRWARQNSAAARNWIATLPAGATRDAALGGFLSAFHDRAPDEATLALFSSETARRRALVDLIARVRRSDQALAKELTSTYLPP